MKTIRKIKMQKACMFLDLAIRRIQGEITREEHMERCNKIHFAYANVYRNIIKTQRNYERVND